MAKYTTLEVPIRDFRQFRVIVIGAGLSGIHLASLFRQYGHNITLQIYEKHEVPGGTWYQNTYPGVACDVPSHGYTLTWAPFANWNRFHAPGADCFEYVKFVSKKARLDDYTRYNSKVLSIVWNEKDGMWDTTLQDTKSGKTFNDRANVVINASGVLSKPKFPDIPGIDKFKGPVLHSGMWDRNIDLTGKRIALVGAGSSAVQMLPELQEKGKRVDQYIRSTTWVPPPGGQDTRSHFFNLSLEETFFGTDTEKLNPAYTEEHKRMFADDPVALQKHRKMILAGTNERFAQGFTDKGSDLSKQTRSVFESIASSQFQKKPELLKYFIPKFSPGCRRVTPALGYVQAVQADNVDVVETTAVAIDETGIVGKDGKHREYDMIAFATGFDTSFATAFEVTGRNGSQLHSDSFRNDPKAYLTAHHTDIPNYYTIGGPNLMSFNGDFLGGLEMICNHCFKFVIKLQRDRYKSVCVKSQAVEDFTNFADNYLERTVHVEGCSSWYKNGESTGRVRAIWPGTSLHMFEALAAPNWEDFDWERYEEEKSGPARFNYLGNGRTLREKEGGDLAYYIDAIPADDKEVPAFNPKDPFAGIPAL